jgi:hypothetical protein
MPHSQLSYVNGSTKPLTEKGLYRAFDNIYILKYIYIEPLTEIMYQGGTH